MRLLQALRNQSAKINADLEDSKLFTHMGDRGECREEIIREFLRPFLPEYYGLSSGEIFASDGCQSAQVDIVVYDAVFSAVLFRNRTRKLFPAESVFGSIEVKSYLSMDELDKACRNIASVKTLHREDSTMQDLLPSVRLNFGDGLTYDKTRRNPYLGVVFAYTGIARETIVEQLSRRVVEAPTTKQHLPDFVFVARPGYVIIRAAELAGQEHLRLTGEQDFDFYRWAETGDDTLPLFYFTINACLAHLRLRVPNFPELWKSVFSELQAKSSGRRSL